jgi:signal transduction histidine kinase
MQGEEVASEESLLEDGPAAGAATDRAARQAAERDRDAAESSRDRFSFLAEASRCLADSLDYETTLTTVAGMALPYLDAWCIVDVVDTADAGDDIRRIAVLHPDPRKQELARRLHANYPPQPEDFIGAPRVIRTGRPEMVFAVPDEALVAQARDPEHLDLLRALGIESYVVAPMVARGRVLGAITFVTAEAGRRFGDIDLLMAEDLARRAAMAIDNARNHRDAIAARDAAAAAEHEATERALRLQALSTALSMSSTERDVSTAVVAHAPEVFGAVGVLVARLTIDRQQLEIVAADGLPDDVGNEWRRFPVEIPAPLSDVARNGAPIFLESRAQWAERYPAMMPLVESVGHHANAVVPLIVEGKVFGALGAAFDAPRTFDADDRALALAVAQQCAQALERARLFESERRARTDAEAANRAKSDFLAAMSHELRTPLNAIGGYAQLLEMGLHGPVTDAQREALGRIELAQRYLLRLVNDVLNVERLQRGHLEYDLQSIALPSIVAEVEALIRPQFRAKSLQYEAKIPPECIVRADGDKVAQILLNLLSNATKFTPGGGRVTLECIQRADGTGDPDIVYVRVADTGVGIPREKLDAVFEPFVQVDTSRTGRAAGAGLGLAISRDLARGMGGDIRVRSTLGRGTAFTLSLPRG